MNIQCPSCLTTYRIAADKLQSDGVRVKCKTCHIVFPVSSDGQVPALIQEFHLFSPEGQSLSPVQANEIQALIHQGKIDKHWEAAVEGAQPKPLPELPRFADLDWTVQQTNSEDTETMEAEPETMSVESFEEDSADMESPATEPNDSGDEFEDIDFNLDSFLDEDSSESEQSEEPADEEDLSAPSLDTDLSDEELMGVDDAEGLEAAVDDLESSLNTLGEDATASEDSLSTDQEPDGAYSLSMDDEFDLDKELSSLFEDGERSAVADERSEDPEDEMPESSNHPSDEGVGASAFETTEDSADEFELGFDEPTDSIGADAIDVPAQNDEESEDESLDFFDAPEPEIDDASADDGSLGDLFGGEGEVSEEDTPGEKSSLFDEAMAQEQMEQDADDDAGGDLDSLFDFDPDDGFSESVSDIQADLEDNLDSDFGDDGVFDSDSNSKIDSSDAFDVDEEGQDEFAEGAFDDEIDATHASAVDLLKAQVRRDKIKKAVKQLVAVVLLIVVILAGIYIAPETARKVPMLDSVVLNFHEKLGTDYHRSIVLQEYWKSGSEKIETWIPNKVIIGLNELDPVLWESPNDQTAHILAARAMMFASLFQNNPLPELAINPAIPQAYAYQQALQNQITPPAKSADEQLALAWQLYKNRQIDEAVQELEGVESDDPTLIQLKKLFQAYLYSDLEETAKAIEILKEVHAKDVGNPWFSLWLARLYWEYTRAPSEVKPYLAIVETEVTELSVTNQVLFYRLNARMLIAENETTLAQNSIRQGTALIADEPVLQTLLSKTYMMQENWAEANLVIQRVREQHPDEIEAIVTQADALLGIGKIQPALTLLEEQIAAHPEAFSLHDKYIETLIHQNRFKLAEQAYQVAITRFPENLKLKQYAAALALSNDDIELAKTRYEELLKVLPNNIEIMAQLVEVSLKQDKFDEAEARLKKLVELDPDNIVTKHQLANLLLAQNKPDEAEKVLTQLTELDKHPMTFELLGRMYMDQKKYDEAIEALTQARDLRPDRWRVHELLGDAYLARNKVADAILSYEKAVKFTDASPAMLLKLANAYDVSNRPGRALDIYKKIVDKSPDNQAALRKLVLGYLQVGQWDDAQAYLFKWQEANPDLAEPYLYLGRSYLYKDEPKKAQEWLRRGVARQPQDVELLSELGWVSLQVGDLGIAKRYLDIARQKDPDNGLIYLRLGYYYKENNQTVDARDAFQQALTYELSKEDTQKAKAELENLRY